MSIRYEEFVQVRLDEPMPVLTDAPYSVKP
jgi:hypothetical protein